MKTAIILAASIALTGVAAPSAFAEEPRTTNVSLADLDLGTREGIQALEDRMARAIARVCHASDARSTKQIRAVRQCRRDLHEQTQSTIALLRDKGRSQPVVSVAVISK